MWVGERVGHTCKYLKYRVAQQRLCFGGGGGGLLGGHWHWV